MMKKSSAWVLLFLAACCLYPAAGRPSPNAWPMRLDTGLIARAGTNSKAKTVGGSTPGILDKLRTKAAINRKRAEDYLREKGIELVEIPKAIAIYELTSAGIMFGVWSLCYLAQPTQRGLTIAKIAKPGTYEAAMAKGQSIAAKKQASSAMRLATSYAESAVLRTAIKPIIIPAKLFITWKLQQAYNVITGKKWGNKGTPARK